MLLFGASSETWATTYCSNRLPASKALLGEPLETGGLDPSAREGEGFTMGGFTDDPCSVSKNLLKCERAPCVRAAPVLHRARLPGR